MDAEIKLIVGLGNPGSEYAGTRHNAGWLVLARLLRQLPGTPERLSGCRSELVRSRWRGRPLWLQWPQTYMNLSGEAVLGLVRREKIETPEILVISDDLDLPLGRLRIRANGSDGGHNGLKSIIGHLGSADFPRLRVGIGRAAGKSGVVDHVLTGFDPEETELAEKSLDFAAEAAKLILARGVKFAMNACNGKDLAEEMAAGEEE